MKWYWKATIAVAFVGSIAMAGAAFGQSDSSSPTPSASASAQQQGARKFGRLGKLGSRVVHGDLKIKTPNGFANVKIDAGTVTAVDANAHTITIRRADGQTVSVTATDKTRVRKEGQKATFADIANGDLVQIIQIDRGDGFIVALIRDRGAASAASTTSDQAPAAAPATTGAF
jgi:hypothetical protein